MFAKPAVALAASAALALAGCSVSLSGPTPDPSAPPASSSPAQSSLGNTYTNDKYGFSFDYPNQFRQIKATDWRAQAGAGSAESVAFFDTSGSKAGGQYRDAMVVNVYQLSQPITGENISLAESELEDSVLPQLRASDPTMQIGALQPVEINGIPGFVSDVSFVTDGTTIKSRAYFLFAGDIEYQILVQAADSKWAALQPTFEQMVQSFRA
ncbi:MAG: PsbP-related protein [Candidatus Nanopelagicales bacterium]|nr:PsbP-related protein [Candidatus Nanopelagicales bacterium]